MFCVGGREGKLKRRILLIFKYLSCKRIVVMLYRCIFGIVVGFNVRKFCLVYNLYVFFDFIRFVLLVRCFVEVCDIGIIIKFLIFVLGE